MFMDLCIWLNIRSANLCYNIVMLKNIVVGLHYIASSWEVAEWLFGRFGGVCSDMMQVVVGLGYSRTKSNSRVSQVHAELSQIPACP